MSDKDNGGYINPLIWAGGCEIQDPGLTRRDWLAGLAVQGILSNPDLIDRIDDAATKYGMLYPDVVSEMAYRQADSTIAEAKK